MLFVTPRRNRAPKAASLNRGHPSLDGLRILQVPEIGFGNIVTGAAPVAVNGATQRAGGIGAGVSWPSVSNIGVRLNSTTALTTGGLGGAGCTVLVVADPIASTTRTIAFSSAEGAQPEFYLWFNATKAGTATAGTFSVNTQSGNGANATGVINGQLRVFVAAIPTAAAPTIYVDGVDLTSSGTAPPSSILSDSGCSDYIGGYSSSGFALAGYGQYLTAAWDRVLSPLEIQRLSRSVLAPFELLAPRRIWVPVSAGGGSASTGEVTATLGALTSAATGSLALNGATSATLGALTSTATGSVSVNATASPTLEALTSSAAGTIRLNAALSSTLADVTLASMAAIGADVNGEVSATLGDATLAATGSASISATLSTTLGAATIAATGSVDIAAALGVTLGNLVLTGAGTSGATLPTYTETLRAAARITTLRPVARVATLRFTD